MQRIAVIGSGISGLAVAHGLKDQAQVTLFEAGAYFGGHAHTVDVTLDGVTHGVDTGFLVLNERTYPRLLKLLRELDVPIAKSEMSFSVQVPEIGLEWSGQSLNTVFAQRRNLLRPGFWHMLADLLRFNRLATTLASSGVGGGVSGGVSSEQNESIGSFLYRHHFSDQFRDWYLLPMLGSIWSCPVDRMLRFPIGGVVQFCHNHGLLQVRNRPQWYTVRGGAARYVEAIVAGLADARLNTPVRSVRRLGGVAGFGGVVRPQPNTGVLITTDAGTERFDAVVMACHSDQSLALLADPSWDEKQVLGAIRYQSNRAVLHTDTAVLPQRRNAWAARNYERATRGADGPAAAGVCLHYLLNRLQPLPFQRPVLVSLNPLREPHASTVLGEYDYAHPVLDTAALAAQQRVDALQGVKQTWFCGAWTRHGFHEDGLLSGQSVCDAVLARWGARDASLERAAA